VNKQGGGEGGQDSANNARKGEEEWFYARDAEIHQERRNHPQKQRRHPPKKRGKKPKKQRTQLLRKEKGDSKKEEHGDSFVRTAIEGEKRGMGLLRPVVRPKKRGGNPVYLAWEDQAQSRREGGKLQPLSERGRTPRGPRREFPFLMSTEICFHVQKKKKPEFGKVIAHGKKKGGGFSAAEKRRGSPGFRKSFPERKEAGGISQKKEGGIIQAVGKEFRIKKRERKREDLLLGPSWKKRGEKRCVL